MKTSFRCLFVVALLCGVGTASGANLSGIDVTVKKDGKIVSRARTDAGGSFATGSLEPGAYSLELR